jgi:threonine synthase
VVYDRSYADLVPLLTPGPVDSFWYYSDFLPTVDRDRVVSFGEGTPPLERWSWLEQRAEREFGVRCQVAVARNDLNGGTHTFKDVAASMAASLFRQHGVDHFVVASTGNIATAYATYLARAGVQLTAFVPDGNNQASVEAIRQIGQDVVVVDGSYADAKQAAAEAAAEHGWLISAGNIDPIRVESKRTMVFEFFRQLGRMPDVYVQAVSGGTGPIAVDKAVRELTPHWDEISQAIVRPTTTGASANDDHGLVGDPGQVRHLGTDTPSRDGSTLAADRSLLRAAQTAAPTDLHLPRIILTQLDTCDPMVQGWETALASGFPDGWEQHYPVIDQPQTMVTTLATGNPGMFPILAPIVRRSGGTYLRTREGEVLAEARRVYQARRLVLGPASIVCLLGFIAALAAGQIHDGDLVVLNTGEGVDRAPDFAAQVRQAT